jgi:hypothetical protein
MLVGKCIEKQPLGRDKEKDNIEMNLRVIGCEGVN